MSKQRRIVIVAARCSQNLSGFGIRFERCGEALWLATWAFALNETAARREGYDRSEISGTIRLDSGYPGCPHCARKMVMCCGSCRKVSCWDGASEIVTCPWCRNRLKVAGEITSLESRNDA